MQRNKLTFNDLPEVVGELCERISSMENLLTEKLHQQHNEVKKDTHVPMTVDEVCEYLGISKSSFITKPNMEVFQSLNKASTCLSIVMNWTNGWKTEEKEKRL